MKFLRGAVLALVVTLSSCNNYQQTKLESEMEKPGVIEVVMFKANENIKPEVAQKQLTRLNDFVAKQPGFISRKTAIADDGQYLDLVFWKDLASAETASEKAMQDPVVAEVFNVIHQDEMLFKHYKVFNEK